MQSGKMKLLSNRKQKILKSYSVAIGAISLTGFLSSCKGNSIGAPENSEVAASTSQNGVVDKLIGANKFLDPYYSSSFNTTTKEYTVTGNFQLSKTSFPKKDIAKYQRAGTAATGTPEPLRGIWWMDGNPLADETVSFADVDFKADKVFLSTFAPNNFSFHSGKTPDDPEYAKGTELWNKGIARRVVYEFEFEGGKESDYKKAVIYPIVTFDTADILGFDLPIKIPKQLLKFTFEYVNDNFYRRNNYFFGVQPKEKEKAGYNFKRILKPDPQDPSKLIPTEHWNEYLTYTGGPQYLRFAEYKK